MILLASSMGSGTSWRLLSPCWYLVIILLG